jgi:DNA-binding MarR family transcriptional regulator
MSQAEGSRQVEERVGYVLKKAANVLRGAMDNALRPLDLTVPQYACLTLLQQKPGLSGSELARAIFVSRQSMNLVVKGLERRELLTRSTVPRRGKALPIELSQAGLDKLAAANAATSAVEKKMSTALTPSGERRLLADLTTCVAVLSDLAQETESE